MSIVLAIDIYRTLVNVVNYSLPAMACEKPALCFGCFLVCTASLAMISFFSSCVAMVLPKNWCHRALPSSCVSRATLWTTGTLLCLRLHTVVHYIWWRNHFINSEGNVIHRTLLNLISVAYRLSPQHNISKIPFFFFKKKRHFTNFMGLYESKVLMKCSGL